MLINVKTPTIVGILTFIGLTNTLPESLNARKIFMFYLGTCSGAFMLNGVEHEKSFITSEPVGFVMLWALAHLSVDNITVLYNILMSNENAPPTKMTISF